MKYFTGSMLGFLIGAAAGCAVIYYNPLTEEPGSAVAGMGEVLSYASPISSGLVFTHGGLSRLPAHPASIPELWEATINKTALSVFALSDENDQLRAVASRISLPSESTELLTQGVLLRDHWLVSIPGEGSMLVTADSNWWPFLKETVIPVWYLGREWKGPAVYEPTVGPSGAGARLVGASGAYAGRRGIATERYHIEAFDRRLGPVHVAAELAWQFTQ